MNHPENDKWLDDALAETIGSKKSRTDFEQWKQKHPQAVEMLTSRANRQAVSPGPLTTRRIIMSNRSKAWKVAAVVAVVIGAGALATTVGIKVRKLYSMGREPDGTYIFKTKPEVGERMRGVSSHHVDDVEQKIKDLEEVELLRKQDTSRELLGIVETEVNGQLQPRALRFKYVLADGREIKIMEGDPDTKNHERNLTSAQRDEVKSLLRADEYEELDIKEKEVRGRIFVFTRMRFVLSDGTEVIKSIGRPKQDQ